MGPDRAWHTIKKYKQSVSESALTILYTGATAELVRLPSFWENFVYEILYSGVVCRTVAREMGSLRLYFMWNTDALRENESLIATIFHSFVEKNRLRDSISPKILSRDMKSLRQ